MRYVIAKAHIAFDDKAYRIYVTEILRSSLGGPSTISYMDLIDRTPKDTRSPEEVVNDLKDKLRKI